MICHCSLDNSPGLYIYFGNITARSVRSCRSLLRSPLLPLFIVPHSERRSPIGPFRLGDSESDEMKGHDLSGSPKTAGHAVMAGLAQKIKPGSARTKDPFSKLQRCATPHALPYNIGNETTILTLFADPRGSYRSSCGNLRSTFSLGY